MAVLGLAIAGVGVWAYLRIPSITVRNFGVNSTGYPCSIGINANEVWLHFTLVNERGGGYAEVVNLVDNNTGQLMPNQYYVPSGNQVAVSQVILTDCNAHWVSVEIIKQWAA